MSNRGHRNPQPRKRIAADARREIIELAATEVFVERGYHGSSMEEIARRSGVSVPVVYDHFASKRDLHRRLLERHSAELLQLWRDNLFAGEPAEERVRRALDAWAMYVESHPYAWQMLFRETSGDAEVQRLYREVQARSRAALGQILAELLDAGTTPGSADQEAMEMAAELIRSALTGLAVWWREHEHVSREQVVATAMNVVWLGLERMRQGERWPIMALERQP